ncbi:hypothetical protein CF166_15790 [Amycolatopsis sp. KNN50.9b]|nr:hypothetical protein CF166_15790 [Amycolatopsis sp. KNN50.9b]
MVAVTIVLGRTRTAASGEFDSDGLSFLGGLFNALFLVVLAFYVVFAWENGDDLDNRAATEADALIDLYWQVDGVPDPARIAVQDLVRGYADEVVDGEWARLADGHDDGAVADLISTMRQRVSALPADTDQLSTARENALQDVRVLDDNHRARVDAATDQDPFTETLLAATIVGAVLMIAFPLLIGLRARRNHVALMAVTAAVLVATVIASIELQDPLNGIFASEPDSFRTVQTTLPDPR